MILLFLLFPKKKLNSSKNNIKFTKKKRKKKAKNHVDGFQIRMNMHGQVRKIFP
jgi:hypothetical protein